MKALLIILLTINTVFAMDAQQAELTSKVKEEMPEWDTTTQDRVETYAPILIEVGLRLDVSPQLLLSVAWAESHFDPTAKSWAGARGIMQVKPSTQKWVFKKTLFSSCKEWSKKKQKIVKNKNCLARQQLIRASYTLMLKKYRVNHKILDNLFAGALYLKDLQDRYDGDIQKTVIAYNEGPTNMYKMIKKNFNLDKHRYYKKIQTRLVAMQ